MNVFGILNPTWCAPVDRGTTSMLTQRLRAKGMLTKWFYIIVGVPMLPANVINQATQAK